jgi:hypothetical protein
MRYNSLLSRADNTVIKAPAFYNLWHGFLYVDSLVDYALHIARANAISRPSAAIRRLNHIHPARCHDNINLLHQFIRQFNRGLFDDLYKVFRHAILFNAFIKHFGKVHGALFRPRVRRNNNRIPSFQGKHGITHRCNNRVRARRNQAYDSHWSGYLGYSRLLVIINYTNGFPVFYTVPYDA